MKFIRFIESTLTYRLDKRRMFLRLALRGEGRRQEGKPVPLIKCTEFRLNYFPRVSRRIRRCVTTHVRRLLVLPSGSRVHGTWQYLEVFRILHEAWICLECCIFFFFALSSECGRGNDDRESMHRFANESAGNTPH